MVAYSTDEDFLDYVQSIFYRNTSREPVTKILDLYPSNPADGSPFDTGNNFSYTPQYKRISAVQGDLLFQAPRRLLLDTYASTHRAYSFRKSYLTTAQSCY